MVRERVGSRNFPNAFIVTIAVESCHDASQLFPVRRPLQVDVGCGRGRFLLAKARENPNVNFLGIDRSTLRLKKLDRKAAEAGLDNIRLIQGDAERIVHEHLAPGSVAAFYVYFPDPWPKRRHHVRRLVSPDFIADIHAALDREGVIHLCTDHGDYFAAISRLWNGDARFGAVPPPIPTDDQETDFGMLFRRTHQPVYRCSFMKSRHLGTLDSPKSSL